MLGGSLALHLLVLAVFLIAHPGSQQPDETPDADQLQVVFQDNSSDTANSTASASPAAPAAVAAGSAAPAPPTPDPTLNTTAASPPPEPAPAPTPAPPTPPEQQPMVEASNQAPEPEPTPPPPTPTPTPPQPQPPATVSLQSPTDETPQFILPPYVPPSAPFVMPPLATPRPPAQPAPPRVARSQPQRSASGFPTPQNWSLNAPAGAASNGGRHGFDTSVAQQGGQKDSSVRHVGGADPGEDWFDKLHSWIAARSYYPEQAASEGHDGDVTVFLRIDRSGHVLSVRMVSSAHEPFLDGAWIDAWRNGVVPPFPAGVTGDTTELNYTVHYHLIRH